MEDQEQMAAQLWEMADHKQVTAAQNWVAVAAPQQLVVAQQLSVAPPHQSEADPKQTMALRLLLESDVRAVRDWVLTEQQLAVAQVVAVGRCKSAPSVVVQQFNFSTSYVAAAVTLTSLLASCCSQFDFPTTVVDLQQSCTPAANSAAARYTREASGSGWSIPDYLGRSLWANLLLASRVLHWGIFFAFLGRFFYCVRVREVAREVRPHETSRGIRETIAKFFLQSTVHENARAIFYSSLNMW